MTEIERKARAMAESIPLEEAYRPPLFTDIRIVWNALCLSIEQHERFRQEVSDAVVDAVAIINNGEEEVAIQELSRFIITKPDPLEEALCDIGLGWFETAGDELRAALDKHGLEIREKSDG